jgi:pyruvate formate lyase activating enzyme
MTSTKNDDCEKALPVIRGFIKSSLLDWDGRVASVIFLPGCNLSCKYCHNWDLVSHPERYKAIPWELINTFLSENLDFVDGVCVTGGEPTIHAGIDGLLERIRSLGLKTKLDTNGTNPEALDRLMSRGLLDAVSMDVKAPLDERYSHIAGPCDIQSIRKSIDAILASSIEHEFRITIVPNFHDVVAVEEIARAIGSRGRLVLQQLVSGRARDDDIRALQPLSTDRLREMAGAARSLVLSVKIRGAQF